MSKFNRQHRHADTSAKDNIGIGAPADLSGTKCNTLPSNTIVVLVSRQKKENCFLRTLVLTIQLHRRPSQRTQPRSGLQRTGRWPARRRNVATTSARAIFGMHEIFLYKSPPVTPFLSSRRRLLKASATSLVVLPLGRARVSGRPSTRSSMRWMRRRATSLSSTCSLHLRRCSAMARTSPR